MRGGVPAPRGGLARALGALLLVGWLGRPSLALAAPRVTLVAPRGVAPGEFETRLRAELGAAGFEVSVIDGPEGLLPEALEQLASREKSAAAILLVRPPGGAFFEVWISDRVTGKTVLRRVAPVAGSAEAGELLALRAVELLRGSLLELRDDHPPRGPEAPTPALSAWLSPAASAPPPAPSAAPAPKPPEPAGAPRRWAALAGLSALGGPGGVPLSLAPTMGASWWPSGGWAIEARVVAPAISTLSGPEGTTSISQAFFGARLRVSPGDPAWRGLPYAFAGAGVYRVAVKGNAVAPYVSNSADLSVLAGLFGLGLRLRLAGQLSLLGEGTVAGVTPRPGIHFADRTLARIAQPLLAGTLGLEMGF